MMLTKEECLEALRTLITRGGDDNELIYWTFAMYGEVQILTDLINEHFDNTPLKFEQLEEGMWVWDNKMVLYIRIAKIIGKTIYAEDFLYGFDCYGRYEENRFYRKEVKE